VSAPSIVIVLELEAAPKVRVAVMNESEEKRLSDWIATHPELCALLGRALALEETSKARET
jgi:hypothetical protein